MPHYLRNAPVRMAIIQSLQTINAGESMEKRNTFVLLVVI